jgi:SAM-dependent methyltransferase
MPALSTDLHTRMFRDSKRKYSLPRRLARAIVRAMQDETYGREWGVIDDVPPLRFFVSRWIKPYVDPNHVAIEIGPGGGRWTEHLLGFGKLYLVDYYEELLDEIKRVTRKQKNVVYIKNNGFDFPGIPDDSVDYCFSFGVFVHLDFDIIESYLDHMFRVLKPGGNIVLQFSDKRKIMAKENDGFADNDPARMRSAILARGFDISEEDDSLLWHSSLVRFTKPM